MHKMVLKVKDYSRDQCKSCILIVILIMQLRKRTFLLVIKHKAATWNESTEIGTWQMGNSGHCFLSFPTGAQQAKVANTENILYSLHWIWSKFNMLWSGWESCSHCSQEVNAKMLIFLVSTFVYSDSSLFTIKKKKRFNLILHVGFY